MSVNKHGLPMHGLKAACAATRGLSYYGLLYGEVSYNRVTGEVSAKCLTRNNWTMHHDPAWIKVAEAHSHMTMQEIADTIADAMQQLAWWERGQIPA